MYKLIIKNLLVLKKTNRLGKLRNDFNLLTCFECHTLNPCDWRPTIENLSYSKLMPCPRNEHPNFTSIGLDPIVKLNMTIK